MATPHSFASAEGGQLHAGFRANVTYCHVSHSGVDATPCGGGISLHVAHRALPICFMSHPAVSNLIVVEGALEPHSLCLQVISHAKHFRRGKLDEHFRKANSYHGPIVSPGCFTGLQDPARLPSYTYDKRSGPRDSSIVRGMGCAARTPRATKPSV